MKKTAIIFLAFIVGLCLAHGAFAADKYMVLLIGVKSGNIEGVYGANQLADNKEGKLILQVNAPLHHTNNGNADGKPKAISDEISSTTHTTIFSSSSPGCRNIWYNGHYVRVCD